MAWQIPKYQRLAGIALVAGVSFFIVAITVSELSTVDRKTNSKKTIVGIEPQPSLFYLAVNITPN